jgi:AraC family transcriptional regulator
VLETRRRVKQIVGEERDGAWSVSGSLCQSARSPLSGSEYIERLSAMFGAEHLPVVIARPARQAEFAATRLKHQTQGSGTLVSSPRVDGFGLTLFLADFPAFDLSVDGRAIRAPAAQVGDFQLHDLSVEIIAHLTRSIDTVYFYIPRAVLNAIADECGAPRIETLHMAPGVGVNDAVVQQLGVSLLPSLEGIEPANRLFMDHVGTALLVHLAHTYGDVPKAPQRESRGLAPWQQRRAEDMIVAHLDGEITLEQLAGDCELSRRDFALLFRNTTGRLPHRWLIERRVERARELLLHSQLPLAQIAALCGFADQSHFTRVFARATGAAPGAWRRQRRG